MYLTIRMMTRVEGKKFIVLVWCSSGSIFVSIEQSAKTRVVRIVKPSSPWQCLFSSYMTVLSSFSQYPRRLVVFIVSQLLSLEVETPPASLYVSIKIGKNFSFL